MYLKLINLSPENFLNLSFISFNNKRFFLIKIQNTFKYYFIPSCLMFKKHNKSILFYSFDQNIYFNYDLYIINFLRFLNNFKKKLKKKILLKGLGFRVFLSENNTEISFKIGFSHLVRLKVPLEITSIIVDKYFLIVESYNAVSLGNFCKKIKQLKTPDPYKNKGFSYKNENLLLKPIKKK